MVKEILPVYEASAVKGIEIAEAMAVEKVISKSLYLLITKELLEGSEESQSFKSLWGNFPLKVYKAVHCLTDEQLKEFVAKFEYSREVTNKFFVALCNYQVMLRDLSKADRSEQKEEIFSRLRASKHLVERLFGDIGVSGLEMIKAKELNEWFNYVPSMLSKTKAISWSDFDQSIAGNADYF